jgi:MOSC domain-containing protein YiiM
VKIISTNTSQPRTIRWKDTDRITGIFKTPNPEGIYLHPEGVKGDTIGNPKVHGGPVKAAYLFSEDWYPYWKEAYPTLDWHFGMFGENLTVKGMNEDDLLMGSLYQAGEAVIRITTPREPCFALGIRFEDQGVVDAFVRHGHPGTYVSVLEPGMVRAGDRVDLLDTPKEKLSISQFYRLWYAAEKDPGLLQIALDHSCVPEEKKKQLEKWLT